MFDSKLERIVLHLLAYGLAAAGIAILQELQVMDFGSYTALASVIVGAALDLLRKYSTAL